MFVDHDISALFCSGLLTNFPSDLKKHSSVVNTQFKQITVTDNYEVDINDAWTIDLIYPSITSTITKQEPTRNLRLVVYIFKYYVTKVYFWLSYPSIVLLYGLVS